MKYLLFLFLVNCASVEAPPQAASQPVVAKPKPKINKFFVNHIVAEDDEQDCVFLEAKEGEKMMHFLFLCDKTLTHVGIEKN